jgi:hypothetical protein
MQILFGTAVLLIAPALGCKTIRSWADLKALEKRRSNSIPTVLCPFRVLKPAREVLNVTGRLRLECSRASRCIVEGDGTHVVVTESNSIVDPSLTGFVFRGGTTTSLKVLRGARLILNRCEFLSNRGDRGGAIQTHPDSVLTVQSSRFLGNAARVGAAVYHEGRHLYVRHSNFVANEAREISVLHVTAATGQERHGSAELLGVLFKNNRAGSPAAGGVVTAKRAGDVVFRSLVRSPGNTGCDGLFLRYKSKCFRFENIPFALGNLTLFENGMALSRGLTIDVLATSGRQISFTSPQATSPASAIPFHYAPDGAAVIPDDDGGMMYVSSSEMPAASGGGLYTLHLDSRGRPKDYYQVLRNTSRNCNGGLTPWLTYVSCEEVPNGQCWQVHPKNHQPPQLLVIGEAAGGLFEAFAVDSRDLQNLASFVTEDKDNGAVRRHRPGSGTQPGWDALHVTNGTVDYLEFLPNQTFRWTTNITAGRLSATAYFKNVEGIVCKDGMLLFVSKVQKQLFELDLDRGTYTVTSTAAGVLAGGGVFDGQPDQVTVTPNQYDYFSEDGGTNPGVFAYDGIVFRALLEGTNSGSTRETTGIDFSTDGTFLLFCEQASGKLFIVRRLDGLPFQGERRVLKWKYGLQRRS